MKENREFLLTSYKRLFLQAFGEHETFFGGSGFEFKELREYVSGDTLRHINAKVSAKKASPFVNVFHDEKKLHISIVLLNSGSLFFGSQKSKYESALEVVSLLCGAAVGHRDGLNLYALSEEENFIVEKIQSSKAAYYAIETLGSRNPLGRSIDYATVQTYLLEKIKRRSLIFLIGDFLEPIDLRLLAAKHEVYCIVIRDRFEEEPQLLGEFSLRDTAGTKQQNVIFTKQNIADYVRRLQRLDALLFEDFKKTGIRASKLYTTEPTALKLAALLRH
jgi:uncharacterized protein (DUF58 family)